MRKADNLPPSCAVVTKSGNLNFLEPSGPVQACNETDLPFTAVNTIGKSHPLRRTIKFGVFHGCKHDGIPKCA